jgi:hypothetical protein
MTHTYHANQSIACGNCGSLKPHQVIRIRRKAMLLDLLEIRQAQQADPDREARWDEIERSFKRRETIISKLNTA